VVQPPRHWVKCELESKELLTFCIKKLKGLNKVKLVDAGFIWTEPHSKRLKVAHLLHFPPPSLETLRHRVLAASHSATCMHRGVCAC
jgi:NMD protein affecting ribosome stability and mRNA decay